MIGSGWLTIWELQNSFWGKRPKTDPWHGQCPPGRVWDSRGGNHLSPHHRAGGWEGSLTIGLHGHAHPRSFSPTLSPFPKHGVLSGTLTVSSGAEQRCLNPRLGAEVETKGSRGIWRHNGFARQPQAGQGEGRLDLARGM